MVARPIFKPQRAMGLGHSTSPVLSTHVNLLCKDANKFAQFLLFKKCIGTGAAPCMLADVSWTRGRYNTLQRQLCW